jgi:hypothetical protein
MEQCQDFSSALERDYNLGSTKANLISELVLEIGLKTLEEKYLQSFLNSRKNVALVQ